MIPKLHSGNNYYGVIHYLENKEEVNTESGKKPGFERLFVSELPADQQTTKAELAGLFVVHDQAFSNKKTKIQKPVFHASLSLAPGEKLDNGQFVEIANSFMEKMGYENQPYVIYRHYDKGHEHIHIVASRINSAGRKINDSNEAKRAIKICRELEKENGLKQVEKKVADKKHSFKDLVENCISKYMQIAEKLDRDELILYLATRNIGVDIKGGKFYYYSLDESGKRASPLQNSSILYRDQAKNLRSNLQAVAVPNKQAIKQFCTAAASFQTIHQRSLQLLANVYGLKLEKVYQRNTPNAAKVLQIMDRYTYFKNYASNKDTAAFEKMFYKKYGYRFNEHTVVINGEEKKLIYYVEKGKKCDVTYYVTKAGSSDIYIKPDSGLNQLLGSRLFEIYERLRQNKCFTQDDIVKAATLSGLDISINIEGKKLKGLTVLYNDFKIKASDLVFENTPLSTALIKDKFSTNQGAANLHLENISQITAEKPAINTELLDIVMTDDLGKPISLRNHKDKQIIALFKQIKNRYIVEKAKNKPEMQQSLRASAGIHENEVRKIMLPGKEGFNKVINKAKDDLEEDIFRIARNDNQ